MATGHVGAQSTLGAPTITSVTATTNSLTVSWSAPPDNGGSAITAYDVRHIPTGAADKADSNWTVEDAWSTGGGSLGHDIKDLLDGVEYDVQVRAVNANGEGPWSATSTGATSDHGGTTATATALSPGSSLPGRIDPTDDEDVFSVVLTSAADLWVYTTGALDTVGELLDFGGAVLDENDEGTLLDSPRAFGIRSELSAGTYYVRVSSFEDRTAGPYTIHARIVAEPGSGLATAKVISLDSATPGRIAGKGGISGDFDYFKLVVTAPTYIWAMAIGENETRDERLNTQGLLLDSGGYLIESSLEGSFIGNETGFLLWRRLAVGTYYIQVNGAYQDDFGPYTLHVRTAADPGDTPATAAPLTLGVPETGRIASSSDSDYFSLSIAGETYVFIYAIAFRSGFPLTGTVLDEQGTTLPMHVIPYANPPGDPHTKQRAFSVWGKLDAGTYHVRVAPSGGSTGSYLLTPTVSAYGRMLEDCTALTTSRSDPWYGCQWHLSNTGQFDGGAMQDINVESVWSGGNMGAGINVVVVDDGLQSDHEDLAANVLTARNHNFSGGGDVYSPLQTHGTAVAGLIAARDNDIGVRSVAPRANIFAYNVTAKLHTATDNEVSAMYRSEDAQHTAISNNSWGSL